MSNTETQATVRLRPTKPCDAESLFGDKCVHHIRGWHTGAWIADPDGGKIRAMWRDPEWDLANHRRRVIADIVRVAWFGGAICLALTAVMLGALILGVIR